MRVIVGVMCVDGRRPEVRHYLGGIFTMRYVINAGCRASELARGEPYIDIIRSQVVPGLI